MDSIAIFCAKYLYIASVLIAAIYWLRADSELRKRVGIFAAIALPITYAVGWIVRQLFDNPRPFVVGRFEPLIEHTADNGFPSDHTLLVAAIASVMTFYDRKIAAVLWFITLLVAWGRVYAGVHHTIDVAGSIVISLAAAGVIYLFGKNKNNHD